MAVGLWLIDDTGVGIHFGQYLYKETCFRCAALAQTQLFGAGSTRSVVRKMKDDAIARDDDQT